VPIALGSAAIHWYSSFISEVRLSNYLPPLFELFEQLTVPQLLFDSEAGSFERSLDESSTS
jgi:hypothetical protein